MATHWGRFIDGLRDAEPLDQLEQVNRYMNDVPHKADAGNYAATDYWATPSQFFNRSGDCEDFAIAKFLSLRALGWDNDQLRIVVLDDLARGTPHAVLVAYHGGEAWDTRQPVCPGGSRRAHRGLSPPLLDQRNQLVAPPFLGR